MDISKLNLSKIRPIAIIGTVVVIAVILALVGLGLLSRNKNQPKPGEIKPSFVPFNPVKLPQPTGFETELDKIKSNLPYRSEKFTIEYISSINIINVKISATSKDDFLKTKLEVENFFKEKGVKDLCQLSIFWIAPKDRAVRETMTPKDLTTTNCPLD